MWFNSSMTTTPHRTVEAHVEWTGEVTPDTDYELVIRHMLVEAGWIDTDSAIQVAGWDSVLVDLNEPTWERLVQEQYIEVDGDQISLGVEYEEE